MPKGVKGFQVGNSGRPLGSKNVTTLLKEERRAIFEQRVSEKFIETIDKARPEYLLDQFLGKAPDKIEHSGELKTSGLTDEQIVAIGEWAKHKLKDDKG